MGPASSTRPSASRSRGSAISPSPTRRRFGTCAFKSAPEDGRVEIAYFTFAEFEGRGLASEMAARLVAIARTHDPAVLLAAQTLPERNASHRVLENLGFRCVGIVDHPEDGPVWEWRLSDHWR